MPELLTILVNKGQTLHLQTADTNDSAAVQHSDVATWNCMYK